MIAADITVLVILLVGITALQIFLSNKENKWLGLTLPAINVFLSIIGFLGRAFYGHESMRQIALQMLPAFLLFNIPALILLAIYFACREKRKRNKEIEKMNIQDLD